MHKYYDLCHFEFISLNIKESNPYEQWLRSLAMSKVDSPDNKQQEQQLCIYNTEERPWPAYDNISTGKRSEFESMIDTST